MPSGHHAVMLVHLSELLDKCKHGLGQVCLAFYSIVLILSLCGNGVCDPIAGRWF